MTLGCSWRVTRTEITQKANPQTFFSPSYVVSRAKNHQYRCFTRATPLVAPEIVHFAPKRNARYTSRIPFPTIPLFVNENCGLFICVTELFSFYWLLVVSFVILIAVPFVFSRSWTSLSGVVKMPLVTNVFEDYASL